MAIEKNQETSPESYLPPRVLSKLEEMGITPEEMTKEEILTLMSLDEETRKEKGIIKQSKTEKNQNTQKTETRKEKLKSMEGQELTPEQAGEFREVVKESGIEVGLTSEEAAPVVEATNSEFTRELNSIEASSAFLSDDDPEKALNQEKIHGEMILLTLNQVHKTNPILESTFGSVGHDGTACRNLYRLLTTLHPHDHIFETDGRISNEGVKIIEKVSATFHELEKKHGSLHHALRDDSSDNPYFCISQQEFTSVRLESDIT